MNGGIIMTIKNVTVKEPGSAITHGIGSIAALAAAAPLIMKAAKEAQPIHIASMAVFIFSMFILYTASTVYHTFDISPAVNKILKKIDHMSIYLLIAGSYTPVCLIVLNGILPKFIISL